MRFWFFYLVPGALEMLEMTKLPGCNITCCDIGSFLKSLFEHETVRPVVIGSFWSLTVFLQMKWNMFSSAHAPSRLPDVQLSDVLVY